MYIQFKWDETKRETNLRVHGIDSVDTHQVFDGLTFTFEDSRFNYGESRYVTLGLLKQFVVTVIHTEHHNVIRIISVRRATKHEQTIYFRQISN